MAKISNLMSTFNNPPHLIEKAILSVMSQSHQDFEIIIKDGDLSHPAIEHPRIAALLDELGTKAKYILAPDGEALGFYGHIGFYEAVNTMIKASTGDIITLLSADDERGPTDTLAYVNEQFEQHGPSPFFLYGQCEWIDADSNRLTTMQPPVVPMTFDLLMNAFTLYIPAFFWNRTVHDKFGYYDEKLVWASDLDFWLRCWRGMDTKFAPRILGKYRKWEVSQCRENQGVFFAPEAEAIRKKHRA